MKFALHLFVGVMISGNIFISGCRGGAKPEARVLTWEAPAFFTDNAALNPSTDLVKYEIYIKTEIDFFLNDNPAATIDAFDNVTGRPTTSFNLSILKNSLNKGMTYYISVRSVAKNGYKSEFSKPASFHF